MLLKGKNTFTQIEIDQIFELIKRRVKASASEQKKIRNEIRKIGFYGKDDWGIVNLQIEDLELLINVGKIEIIKDEKTNLTQSKVNKNWPQIVDSMSHKINTERTSFSNVNFSVEQNCNNIFKSFDPLCNNDREIDNKAGNYIICLRKGSKLPKVDINPIFKTFKGLEVIYTGIASKSLRNRDYKQHFTGNNAGSSTLRKSLGSLFGYNKILRDSKTKKRTKFNPEDEQKLSEWMKANLILYYSTSKDYLKIEEELIKSLNPPLNIKDNYNIENKEFRNLLSKLRKLSVVN